ncbi:MAG TPA: response regulator [Acidimicrobiales bacterium]|jgi:DNA-binding response OmpR family regulator|nr:response regulator [Acidimicrobiales bacterium]
MTSAHVLVVDDAEDIRLLVVIRLKLAGFEASEASNGADAIAQASAAAPDLILLDWVMPGLDGIEVCRRLKSNPATAGVPIILLTGRVLPDEERMAVEVGAEGLIAKPFDVDELIDRVRETLLLG